MLTIAIQDQKLLDLIERAKKLNDKMPKLIAHAGANAVIDHFHALNRSRSSRSDYYARAAGSTFPIVEGDKIGVGIDHVGIALRRFGGTVRPRTAKFLSIPVADESYGKRMREFENLEIIYNRKKGKGVAKIGSRVLFALTQQATHKPDATVLPTDNQLADPILRIINYEIQKLE